MIGAPLIGRGFFDKSGTYSCLFDGVTVVAHFVPCVDWRPKTLAHNTDASELE